jgi:hypothetical protein
MRSLVAKAWGTAKIRNYREQFEKDAEVKKMSNLVPLKGAYINQDAMSEQLFEGNRSRSKVSPNWTSIGMFQATNYKWLLFKTQ